MDNNTVMVRSACDMTVVINVPDIPLHRVWKKRGATYPFERKLLQQIYYLPSVEYLFKHGMLMTDDKEFLTEVGLMDAEGNCDIIELDINLMNRAIRAMPLHDLKDMLGKLNHTQRQQLGDYAIENWKSLNMDRVDILSSATGKNILKAIENFKAAQED